MVTILKKYVLCEGCWIVWVKKTHAKHKHKPLCKDCRGHSVVIKRQKRKQRQVKQR